MLNREMGEREAWDAKSVSWSPNACFARSGGLLCLCFIVHLRWLTDAEKRLPKSAAAEAGFLE